MLDKITSYVRRCIDDYGMIGVGESVAVGVSGGKDSMVLLCAMANLRRFHPSGFSLHAVTLDMGVQGMDFSPVEELCKELDVPYTYKLSDISRVIFEERKEKNPCSLCAAMRRAKLCSMVKELGIKKIALAHHFDDAVETFLLSLLYEGRIHCFHPVTYLDRMDVTQIRPMLYVEEKTIRKFEAAKGLRIVENPCPMNGVSKREDVKALIKTLSVEYPDIKSKLFGAMKRLPLKGWETSFAEAIQNDNKMEIC